MKIQTVLDQIELGSITLPAFQRGYVWNREQVRGLMSSLYRGYPIGGLLIWETKTDSRIIRGNKKVASGTVKLLLDGQQRMTTLYGIINGYPPKFFDGNPKTFLGLHFHLEDEVFEFYSSSKMKDNPLWINVFDLMKEGAGRFIPNIIKEPRMQDNLQEYINRLNRIDSIKTAELYIDQISGEDKLIDAIVEIFNKINSGGTKLSKGDLALAKICSAWPEARDEMKRKLKRWADAGFNNFRLEWLLRNVNSIVTGEALFSAFRDVSIEDFKKGLNDAEKTIDKLLIIISSRLGLDHARVLGSRYAFPLMSRYLIRSKKKQLDYKERDKLLYWYIHTFLWGRYAGSTESVLKQDLNLIEEIDGGLDRLISQLRQHRADLKLNPEDFSGWSKGARFYPLIYMLTRICGAKDWGSGVELSQESLGALSELEIHHIFPRAYLYKHGYRKSEVNAVANFTFLTKETNLEIKDRAPDDYFEEYVLKHPGAVESHWIPMDKTLWNINKYREFLAARRELMAKAANDFLETLLHGKMPEKEIREDITKRKITGIPCSIATDLEEQKIIDCMKWIADQDLPEGEKEYELCDEETGESLAVLDLAWPDGFQEGLTQPVALIIDEAKEIENILSKVGYRFFTNIKDLKQYIKKEILSEKLT